MSVHLENTYIKDQQNRTYFLNETGDEISDNFKRKIKAYKAEKLHILATQMQDEIMCNGSVYTGSAGIATYFCLNALVNNDVNENMLQHALKYVNLNGLKGKRISFLCGDAGPLALLTVISYKLGSKRPEDVPDYKTLSKRLISLGSLLRDSPDELLYGKSGYLYALLFVNNNTNGDLIPAKYIEKVVSAILDSGMQFSSEVDLGCPMLWQWYNKIYLGAAHGMAGILYMLLQARNYYTTIETFGLLKLTLDWLLNLKFPSGNFPSSLKSGSGDRLVQWCHGAPGFVPLCLIAHKLYKEDYYLRVAKKCGDVIWQRGLTQKGYSLCHGVSGNAFAFIQLYQETQDPEYLYRACCFMDWCIEEKPGTEQHKPDRPASLFEGVTGRILLADALLNVHEAKFPALTI